MSQARREIRIHWTEEHVRKLELHLGRNLDNIRLRHGLPLPKATAPTTVTPTTTDEAKK